MVAQERFELSSTIFKSFLPVNTSRGPTPALQFAFEAILHALIMSNASFF